MKLDLSEIAAHVGKRIRYEMDEPPIEDPASGLKCVERITGEATFANTGSSIIVRGKFRTTIELDCGRCLTNYRTDVEMPIEEELPLEGHVFGDEDEEEELPEDEKEPLFEENIFNLDEFLRQSILVAVPIGPVCSKACAGLCPHCGKNLNEGPCECPSDEAASPFAGLASLLEDKQEE